MSNTKAASHSHMDLKKSALSLLNATSHVTDHKVAEARESLSKIIENISDGVEEVEECAAQKIKQAKNFVSEHPYKAAGLAVGVGAVIALVLALRKK